MDEYDREKMIEIIRGKWTDKDQIELEISDKVYELIDLKEMSHKQALLTLTDILFMVNDISEVMLNESLMNDSVKTLLWQDYAAIEDTEFENTLED